jgi:hypothetical protein
VRREHLAQVSRKFHSLLVTLGPAAIGIPDRGNRHLVSFKTLVAFHSEESSGERDVSNWAKLALRVSLSAVCSFRFRRL